MSSQDLSLKGFNAGYIVQKHEPELAKKILGDFEQSDDAYLNGFVAGAKEYQLEVELEKANRFPGMDNIDLRFSEKDIELDRDNKDLDIDI